MSELEQSANEVGTHVTGRARDGDAHGVHSSPAATQPATCRWVAPAHALLPSLALSWYCHAMNRFGRVVPVALFAWALSTCKPAFKHAGSISVDGESFQPEACHILSTCTGIALIGATGDRLELRLPAARVEAWRDTKGPPRVTFTPKTGKAATELAPCGLLVLTGEGYHEPKGRAASGHIHLSCSGDVTVQADLEFSGCF